MTREERTKRINAIPHEVTRLKKEKAYFEKRGNLGSANKTQLRIEALQKEFSDLYNSYGKKEVQK